MAEPPAKRRNLDMSKTFTAVVGDKEKEFMLHTNVASRSSKFFSAAMNNDWREAQQNRITTKRNRSVRLRALPSVVSAHDHSFLDDATFRQLAKLYIVGDFLDDSPFRVDMLKRFTSRAIAQNVYPDLDTIIIIWD